MAKVSSIQPAGRQDVYNMEVERHHNFSIEGGLIVHNCYDGAGYGLISYHVGATKPLPEEVPLIRAHKDKMARKTRVNRRFM